MQDEVWGGVKTWGLKDCSDHSVEYSVDPVCGKRVEEAKAAGKTEYAGVVRYFCTKECQKRFEAAPGNYIGQPHWPSRRAIDINSASAEDLRSIFQDNEASVDHILQNRPYQSWVEFQMKNPGISERMLECLRQSGLSISTPDLNRIV